MQTYRKIQKVSLFLIVVVLSLTSCSRFTVTELENNRYSIGSYPHFSPIWGDILLMPETGASFENRRQKVIQRIEKYCEKHGRIVEIESIKAVPPFHEGDSGVEVIFSCFSDPSTN